MILLLVGCDAQISDVKGPDTDDSRATGETGTPEGGRCVDLDATLDALRADLDGTLLACSREGGWPLPLADGQLFVYPASGSWSLAGDFDGWTGTPMTEDDGFRWIVQAAEGRYKFTNGSEWNADPWSRRYEYDEFGEMSLASASGAHLERQFEVGSAELEARTLRIWVPAGTADRVLYMHDGRNLFDPTAIWGGWHAQDTAPDGMMLVGIDNTDARMEEYTHCQDVYDGVTYGGDGAKYAAYLQEEVRPLIDSIYGEPAIVGTLGSSLGGLISFYIADLYPDEYAFAGSMSGTMGWGSIGATNETMIQRYARAGHRSTALYVDSGGNGTTCADSDGDGTDDDDYGSADNYCENIQLRDTLEAAGYQYDVDLWHWWEPDAEHNEMEWAARLSIPFSAFESI